MDEAARFRAMFSDEDGAEMAAAWARAEAEEAIRQNNVDTAMDPALAWRTALSAACTEEGVSYVWLMDEGLTTAFALGHHPIRVPDEVIEGLREQGAHPHAVACHLKAVSIDPRFASWDEEDGE